MSKLEIHTEAVERLGAAFRQIGAQMMSGLTQLNATLESDRRMRKLYRIDDQWLRIWVLHLNRTTDMNFDKAWTTVVWLAKVEVRQYDLR